MSSDSDRRFEWHQLEVDGGRALAATGGSGRDVTIAFVHGFACTPRFAHRRTLNRLLQTPLFDNDRCRIVAPVLPGFDGTDPLPPERTTLGDYADWYAQCLDTLGVDGPYVLIGESMGGAIAMTFADRHPDSTHSIAVFNSVGGYLEGRHRHRWVGGLMRGILGHRATAKQWSASIRDAAMLARHPRSSWLLAHRIVEANLESELRRLRERQVPLVAVFGRRDPIVLQDSATAFREALGVEPLFIDSDHGSFLGGHPAIEVLVGELVTAALDGRALPPDPGSAMSYALRKKGHIESAMFSGGEHDGH